MQAKIWKTKTKTVKFLSMSFRLGTIPCGGFRAAVSVRDQFRAFPVPCRRFSARCKRGGFRAQYLNKWKYGVSRRFFCFSYFLQSTEHSYGNQVGVFGITYDEILVSTFFLQVEKSYYIIEKGVCICPFI